MMTWINYTRTWINYRRTCINYRRTCINYRRTCINYRRTCINYRRIWIYCVWISIKYVFILIKCVLILIKSGFFVFFTTFPFYKIDNHSSYNTFDNTGNNFWFWWRRNFIIIRFKCSWKEFNCLSFKILIRTTTQKIFASIFFWIPILSLIYTWPKIFIWRSNIIFWPVILNWDSLFCLYQISWIWMNNSFKGITFTWNQICFIVPIEKYLCFSFLKCLYILILVWYIETKYFIIISFYQNKKTIRSFKKIDYFLLYITF